MAQLRDTIVIDKPRAPLMEDILKTPEADIVGFVMGQVGPNRKHRDNAFKPRWDEYYRIWRGQWSPEDKNRKSERSRIISPATQMAIDLTIAELIEAIFGTDQWFDLPDDIDDEQHEDMQQVRDRLRDDLYKDGIIHHMVEILQNGALYGQLIAKIVTEVRKEPTAVKVQREGQEQLRNGFVERVAVFPVAIEPGQLVWDMSGPTQADAMAGLAHEFPMPLHLVKERQRDGIYLSSAIVGSNMMAEDATADRSIQGENPKDGNQNRALVTEYHGLVPKRMMTRFRGGDEVAAALAKTIDEDEMIEAVVTIANESILLRAIPNPSVMNDRAIVSEQFDTVPNRFIGRGLVEKAYHSQKGLDTELRARADSLMWSNNPMLAADLNRLPPRMDLNIWPGKLLGTRGNPGEILREFRFGDVNASTFQQTAEYQQMVAQATGARDPADVNAGVRDQATGATSINMSGMIKRNRRTMFNVESFLNQLLRRITWRKMQFDPQRYPQDLEFKVKGTVGIMSREIEMSQLTNLLQHTQNIPAMHGVIVQSIFENSSSPNKGKLVAALKQAMQPDPEQQKKQAQMEQLQMQAAVLANRETEAKIAKLMAEAGVKGAEEQLKNVMAKVEQDSLMLDRITKLVDVSQVEVQQAQVKQQDRALNQRDRELSIQERSLTQKSKG
jgi:hypothetical protein